MNPAQPYLDLLRSERERLRAQGWVILSKGELGEGSIRNAEGRCPICAFAVLHGVDKYYTSWMFALRELFGLDADYSDATYLILAADGMQRLGPNVVEMRAGLLELLGLEEV